MKKISFLCLVLLLLGCNIQYEGDNRLMVSGKIIDKNGNPIPDIEVITNVSNGTGFGSRNDDIGIDLTDNQGNFIMLFPKPRRAEITYSIHFQDYEGLYQKKRFVNILYENFSNLSYNLGEVELYKQDDIVNLKLSFSTENYSKQITEVNLVGEISDNEVWINPPDNNYHYSQYFYQVIKNQTITVEYIVYDYSNNQTTTHTENIEIGEENLIYTLNY